MNKKALNNMVGRVDELVDFFFEEEDVLTASVSRPEQRVKGVLWRHRESGRLMEERAMLAHMNKAAEDDDFSRDYRIVKLARERGLVK